MFREGVHGRLAIEAVDRAYVAIIPDIGYHTGTSHDDQPNGMDAYTRAAIAGPTQQISTPTPVPGSSGRSIRSAAIVTTLYVRARLSWARQVGATI